MPVWSGETLKLRLPALIRPYDPGAIDCAAYTLHVGGELYVSPSDLKHVEESAVRRLRPGEDSVIPPGQFAFLITEEEVAVPEGALALISIKAKIKWRGLVNVSGFHVDPGYRGKLIFAAFNAGPSPIHLRRGEECFLIWYLSLDTVPSNSVKSGRGYMNITSELVSPVSGEWKSLSMLDSRLDKVERTQAGINAAVAALVALSTAIFVLLITRMFVSNGF